MTVNRRSQHHSLSSFQCDLVPACLSLYFCLTSANSQHDSWEWLRKKAAQKGNAVRAAPLEDIVLRELEAFLSEPILPIMDLSLSTSSAATSSTTQGNTPITPLQWWAENQCKYPSLCVVVRILLSVPATSVSSERLFSKTGQVISDRRSRLTPQHAEELCFLSQNWVDK